MPIKKSFRDMRDALDDADDIDQEQAMARMATPISWRRIRRAIARMFGRQTQDAENS